VRERSAGLGELVLGGTKIFFVDEAHFRAAAEMRRMRVQRGQPALSSGGGW
jgi:hypothetical protein